MALVSSPPPPFAPTPAELAAVVADLAPRVRGCRIQRVWQPDADSVVLALHGVDGTLHLSLCVSPGVVALGEAAGKPAQAAPPWALGQWLRAQVGGELVVDLAMPRGSRDRVVELTYPGGRLVAELLPRGACLVALDGEGIVRAATRLPEGGRGLATGAPYVPLPPRPSLEAPTNERPPRFTTGREAEAAAEAARAAWAAYANERARERWLALARQRLSRLRAHLAHDLVRLGDFERARVEGELLAAQWQGLGLRRGATQVQVADWYADGAPAREIALDPKLDPAGNVARLFQRYRKGRDGRAKVEQRQFEVEQALDLLDVLEATPGTLDGAQIALRRLGPGLAPPRPRAVGETNATTAKGGQPGRLPYRPFVSRAGERILVGRGGADNHALTFRVARGNDTWLHVRDAPGAHVVVPQPGRGRPPHPETLLDAAALAMHHSDLRGEPVGEVTVVARKHVRAIPGGPPGRVTVAGARTVTVTDVAARVERLYRAIAEGPDDAGGGAA